MPNKFIILYPNETPGPTYQKQYAGTPSSLFYPLIAAASDPYGHRRWQI